MRRTCLLLTQSGQGVIYFAVMRSAVLDAQWPAKAFAED